MRVPLHPMLVTVPIGCWVAAAVFDIGSHSVATPGFLVEGGTWLIAIGVIVAVVAGLVGLVDAIPIPPGTAANRAAVVHLSVATLGIILAATDLVLRLGLPTTAPTPAGEATLTVLTVLVVAVGGWYGGQVVHRHGFGAEPAETVDPAGPAETGEPAEPVESTQVSTQDG
jgi:uncharacterized membrane protein